MANISKVKRDELLKKIDSIKEYLLLSSIRDNKTEDLISCLNELKLEVDNKKYGLTFQEHRENIDEVLSDNIPVFIEEKDLKINDFGGKYNFLLEVDNLPSLELLLKTHKKRIDVIYIDPPYNTGKKDFVYDDAFVDKNDTYKHSKWLSFMKKDF